MAVRKNQAAKAQKTAEVGEKETHLIGYARVSMADQTPRLQIDALVAAGVAEADIYVEQATGAHTRRPEFQAMMKDIRPGDVVVVWKLDRLARNAGDLYKTAQVIQDKGAHLRIVTHPGLDTTTAMGRAMFGMLAVFAEFERAMIHERTMAGLRAAREAGRVGGRKKVYSDEQIREAAAKGTAAGARWLGMSKAQLIRRMKGLGLSNGD